MTIKKGRVALVTGAGQGIGKGIALKLAENGAHVAVCDINEKAAQEVKDEIIASGYEAIAVNGDVGSKQDCIRFVQTSLEHWGTVDILVNNAGIIRDALIEKMTEEQWDAVLRVNLKGAFLCMQAAMEPMKLQKYGRIINISSSSWSWFLLQKRPVILPGRLYMLMVVCKQVLKCSNYFRSHCILLFSPPNIVGCYWKAL
jgi:NAD(P)-dependent dehydrogenase (short-subunit alcohol dehydrogenase family)